MSARKKECKHGHAMTGDNVHTRYSARVARQAQQAREKALDARMRTEVRR